jgi:hypothetical protein
MFPKFTFRYVAGREARAPSSIQKVEGILYQAAASGFEAKKRTKLALEN